ncbi:hypothetical protein N8D56_04925 [Devosia sp. A8/3-2]|nr:hypothetical protein N8D56_04925 [Devosia sp. A8/3-2]
MTLSEFKAWFEGYTEGLDGAPTEKQFKRIKAKVAEITSTPISYPVFIDRYRDVWPRYHETGWPQPIVSWASAGTTGGQGVGSAVLMNTQHSDCPGRRGRMGQPRRNVCGWQSRRPRRRPLTSPAFP